MKKWKAFITAVLLSALTIVLLHGMVAGKAGRNNPAFSMWPNENKSKSRLAIDANLNAETLPVFGSSEFQHGLDSPYHPQKVFQGTDFNPMLIGAGYYQSLSHAVTLSSIAPKLKVKAAVLFVSPQWFRHTGVVSEAYASRFSESHYLGMLKNKNLSAETRTYMEQRTHKLLESDEKTNDRIKLYEKTLQKQEGTAVEKIYVSLWEKFLKEKETFQTVVQSAAAGINPDRQAGNSRKIEEKDWKKLLQDAEAEGKKDRQNQFFIENKSYQRLKKHLKVKKGKNAGARNGYQNSPEYADLECFLQVCRENGIKPMLVILPVNGYYYDYTGFPKEARERYYAKINALAQKYDAETADFSKDEYTKYFFEDQIHIGRKGWVDINEKLYQFYQKTKSEQKVPVS